MITQASNLPKRVEDLVKEITRKSPGYSKAQVWATAWSIYCKHIKPGDPHCSMAPEEYLSKKAMQWKELPTAQLPPTIKKVLAEVRFNKRKISVSISNTFSMYSAGDDGAKGFAARVDIDTNQYDITWGAFGGGALGQKPSPVDDVNTPTKPLPDHLIVIRGQIGGRDPSASITCTEATFKRLAGAPRMANGDYSAQALEDKLAEMLSAAHQANGDMLQYFADNPDKLAEKQERDKAKKRAEWKGWNDQIPVQVVTKGSHVEVFPNLAAAQAKYPTLDPRKNTKLFTWAMRGEVHGRTAIRFEDWETERMMSMSASIKTANEPATFINTKTKALAKAAYGKLKDIKASFEKEPDLPSNVGGLIKYLFLALGNRTAETALHSFFGNMRGVGSGFGTNNELMALARDLAHKVNEGEAVAIGLLLLRAVKRPRAATAFEAWAQKHLDLTQHDPASSAAEKVLRPGDTFEATITPEIKGMAVWAWQQIGKNPAAADTLSFAIAENVNWRIQGVGEHDGVVLPDDVVIHISQELDYALESTASFIVALLRVAGLKRAAEMVKKQALMEFSDSYSAMARVAARVMNAMNRQAFNKFNAPELVSQLLAVLEKEGLKDALNQIKMKKVPELVEKAWSSRSKEA